MYIRNMLLCIGSLVIIVTCVDASAVLSSEKVDVKDLAKRFVKLLESEIQTSGTLVSTAYEKDAVFKRLNAVQRTLNCYTNSQEYIGETSRTKSGIVCQYWSTDFPHAHPYTYFPDGSVKKARNYCRDPANSGIPWCYTVEPETRYEDCSVPRCDTL